jgi:hypothetical protein
MADQKPAQHIPVHQREDAGVFDPKHPAASVFAPAQPGAGVVADDVEELGQNLAGGEPASKANETWKDQKEVLRQQHYEKLQAGAPPEQDEGELEVDPHKGTATAKPAAGGDKGADKSAPTTPPKEADAKK